MTDIEQKAPPFTAADVWDQAWDAMTGTPPNPDSPNAPLNAAAAVIQAYGDQREAKFKALTETLATDLRECARALQSLHQIPGTGADGRLWQRIKEITDAAHAAIAQYKEARDAE